MRRGAALALFLLLSLFPARLALAARAGTVDADEADLLEGPGKKFKLLEKLVKGTQVSASNMPTEGYFKIRTGNGSVGWISADALVLQPSADTDNPDPMMAVPAPSAAAAPQPAAVIQTDFRRKPRRQYVRLHGVGGGTLFNLKEANELIGFDALKYGYQYGGQLDFMWNTDLAMVVRVEWMKRTALGIENKSKDTIQFDISSMPLMVGIDMTIAQEGKIASHFAIMGGLALNTQLNATDKSQAEPNVTTLSAQAFTGLAKLQLDFNFSHVIGLFAEVGYRYLKTVQIAPATTVNGSQIFQQSNNYVPISLDLSGPVFGGGLTITF